MLPSLVVTCCWLHGIQLLRGVEEEQDQDEERKTFVLMQICLILYVVILPLPSASSALEWSAIQAWM